MIKMMIKNNFTWRKSNFTIKTVYSLMNCQ